MYKIIFLVVVFIAAVLFGPSVSAHVLVRDDSKSASAILHVIPDDDPIAGQRSELVFDIKTSRSIKSAGLVIGNNESQKISEIPVIINGNILSAAYIFPNQGMYDIKLSVKTEGKDYIFSYSQRVSRGSSALLPVKRSHPWADVGIIITTCLIFLLIFIAIAHRKQISLQSKM